MRLEAYLLPAISVRVVLKHHQVANILMRKLLLITAVVLWYLQHHLPS